MRLTLTKDDGTVIEMWYLNENEITEKKAKERIELALPAWESKEQYEVELES